MPGFQQYLHRGRRAGLARITVTAAAVTIIAGLLGALPAAAAAQPSRAAKAATTCYWSTDTEHGYHYDSPIYNIHVNLDISISVMTTAGGSYCGVAGDGWCATNTGSANIYIQLVNDFSTDGNFVGRYWSEPLVHPGQRVCVDSGGHNAAHSAQAVGYLYSTGNDSLSTTSAYTIGAL